METFGFYLDTKVTTWMRTPFEIEAETLEEAKLKAIEFHKQGNTLEISWDVCNDLTPEIMSIEENGGEATEELFSDDDVNIIWDNVEK